MNIRLTFLDLRGPAPCPMTNPPDHAVVCLGNFDGVHRAHKVLLRETVAMTRELSEKEGRHVSPGAFCFIRPTLDYKKDPTGFVPVQVRGHLTTLRDKLLLFAGMGLEFACLCNFPDVRDLSPRSSSPCCGTIATAWVPPAASTTSLARARRATSPLCGTPSAGITCSSSPK